MFQGNRKQFFKTTILYLAMSTAVLMQGFFVSAAEYDPQSRRDPFVPLAGVFIDADASGGAILSINDVLLQGIVTGADGINSAIINNQVMREGDTKDSMEIKSIGEGEIEIIINDQSHKVKLYDE